MADPDLGHGDADRELVIFAGEEPIGRLQLQDSKRYDRVVVRSLRAFADALENNAPEGVIDPDDCSFTVDHAGTGWEGQ